MIKSSSKKTRAVSVFRGVIFPGLMIFIFVTIFLFVLYDKESTFFKNLSANEVRNTISLINKRLQISVAANESLRSFFENNQSITNEEFATFASHLTEQTFPQGLRLTFAQLDEKNVLRYVYPPNKNMERSPKQSADDIKSLSSIVDEVALEKAKQTHASVVAEPTILKQGFPVFIIYTPIFKGNVYIGSALCIMRISDLLSFSAASLYKRDEYIKTAHFIIPFERDEIFGLEDHPTETKKDEKFDMAFVDKQWEFRFSLNYANELSKRIMMDALAGYSFSIIIVYLFFVVYQRNKKLFQERARTYALISSIGEGLVATNKNGIITYMNDEAKKLSRYDTGEVIGKKYTEIWRIVDEKGRRVAEEDHPFYKALINKKKTEISTVSKLFMLRKDGTRFAFSSNITPILDNVGDVDGVMVTLEDNTQESEIDRMKTEFLFLASHQLLTPIAAIKLISEMFITGYYGVLNDGEQKENMQSIHTLADRMGGLVKSLLNISRIESGRIIISPKPTNLKDLIVELCAELKNKIEDKKQTLNITVDKDLGEIHIDPQLIREVYKNFLTNAIKYTPAGGIISVDVTIQDQEVISKISDTGYGIPESEKSKVFEKFYRGGNIIKNEKDGNGLGLYLVKQIIEVSEGKVWFESKENKGTTFWFSLPLAGNKAKAGEVVLG